MVSVEEVANNLSGLRAAQDNMKQAALALKSMDSFVGVIKGGSMSVRTIAQTTYDAASFLLNNAQIAYKVFYMGVKAIYAAVKFGIKQLVAYLLKRGF